MYEVTRRGWSKDFDVGEGQFANNGSSILGDLQQYDMVYGTYTNSNGAL